MVSWPPKLSHPWQHVTNNSIFTWRSENSQVVKSAQRLAHVHSTEFAKYLTPYSEVHYGSRIQIADNYTVIKVTILHRQRYYAYCSASSFQKCVTDANMKWSCEANSHWKFKMMHGNEISEQLVYLFNSILYASKIFTFSEINAIMHS